MYSFENQTAILTTNLKWEQNWEYACFLNFEPHKCNHFSFTVGLTFPLQGKRKLEKVISSYFRIFPWFFISRNYDRPEKVSRSGQKSDWSFYFFKFKIYYTIYSSRVAQLASLIIKNPLEIYKMYASWI